MPERRILIGTTKGLVEIGKNEFGDWGVCAIHFRGFPVSMFFDDIENSTWWTAIAHRHWGPKLYTSKDKGLTWHEMITPGLGQGKRLPNGKPAVLRRIWYMERAGDQLLLGIEPGAMMSMRDGESVFSLVEGLWNHPSRQDPNQWFGAGRDYSFLHSIVVDPRDVEHVFIAVSCAGVFETHDGGVTWKARNNGLVAAYLPNPGVEVGHDPHRILCCEANPEVMWQQNHCGIFRSTDGGANWIDVTDKTGLANYGFALAIDHQKPKRAWVIPAVSDEERIAADLSLCVCRTDDGGETWLPQRNGLPHEYCFDIVFRHAFARSLNGDVMAFGTSNGNVYLSEDDGESWLELSNYLARVETVAFIN